LLGLPIPQTLASYFRKVEARYCDNPYHNQLHASAVLQRAYMLLFPGGVAAAECLDDMDRLAVMFAAAVHDLGEQFRDMCLSVRVLVTWTARRSCLPRQSTTWAEFKLSVYTLLTWAA
jgi:hypothetical protein